MTNIERLISMLMQAEPCEWTEALKSVIRSPDVAEIAGYPRVDRASFILAQAKMRQSNSRRLGLKTFGLDSLITALGKLQPDAQLTNYGIENGLYTGSCFVFDNNNLIGCEFVAKGLAKTIPFRG